jgi:murein DD-endopeptidase MepM/ murein hydrolase activator NlpD
MNIAKKKSSNLHRHGVVITMLVIATLILSPLQVFAREKATYDPTFFGKNDILMYSPVDVGCYSDGDSELSGIDTEEKIWNYLTEKHLSAEQISGVMGNMNHESLLRTEKINDDSYGIVAWKGDALTALKESAEENSKELSDLAFQLDYLYAELGARKTTMPENSSYASVWEGLTKQETVDDALVFFHNEYEGSDLLDFDKDADTEAHKAAVEFYGRDYTNSRDAIIDQRGGNETNTGSDPNGQHGAQYFFIQYGGEDNEEVGRCLSGGGTAVHPIADGDRVWEGYGGPRPDLGSVYCGGVKWHNGYDLNGQLNTTPVKAAMDGTVTSIDSAHPALDTVSITHPDGFRIRYMHMNTGQIDVSVGDTVTTGQVIGRVGNGNGAYGAHLHVEVDVAGNTNPAVAKLHTNSCGIKSVNPHLFFLIFGVDLCPTNNCDNSTTEL